VPDPAPILRRLREILSIPGDRVGKARRISSAIHEGGFPWVGLYDGETLLAWSPPGPSPEKKAVLKIPIEGFGFLEAASDGNTDDRLCLERCAEAIRPLWGA